ncbi:MAG: alpha/beta hydrolase [Clostridia bacterium]|nr:alpha/beta hydrolase [Clostridia bacterium]
MDIQSKFFNKNGISLHYYEIENDLTPLVMIHAQGVDGLNFENTFKKLSNKYHIYSIDCYGHGKSLHDSSKYNLMDISSAVMEFVIDVVKRKTYLLGHSSGGLIAACTAARADVCERLILEDPPFFSCQGDRRFNAYNYVDLSTVCHNFLQQDTETDFVSYYFQNQYMWNFFPEKVREKARKKLSENVKKQREKNPDGELKVTGFPKNALAGFKGMNNYDPKFGEAFYTNSFNEGVRHSDMLKRIKCPTVFFKATTDQSADGLLLAALSEDDLARVCQLVDDCEVIRFNSGHAIHIEKEKEFVQAMLGL